MSRLLDLDAYVSGDMADADADAFEEALFDAPDDADLAFIDRVSRHGTKLVAHNTWDMGATKAQIDALAARGLKIQIFDAGPAGSRAGLRGIEPDADLLVTALRFGRTDIERVDVEVNIVDFGVQKVIKDALVDPTDGTLYGVCEIPLAKLAFGAGRTITHVRRRDGAREILATWDLSGPTP